MAEFETRIRHSARSEYVLPNPTNWAEVEKVLSAIRADLSGENLSDDRVTVTATDDEIVFSYQLTDGIS